MASPQTGSGWSLPSIWVILDPFVLEGSESQKVWLVPTILLPSSQADSKMWCWGSVAQPFGSSMLFIIYMKLLGEVVSGLGLQYHQHTDDIQFYLRLLSDPREAVEEVGRGPERDE